MFYIDKFILLHKYLISKKMNILIERVLQNAKKYTSQTLTGL